MYMEGTRFFAVGPHINAPQRVRQVDLDGRILMPRLSNAKFTLFNFQYLPHRRRQCVEPNQAHLPAAPAAIERKQPVDARWQLCPQV